jgi:predicted small secreted protein
MRRSIPHGCVARRLNSLQFALLASCHAGASTPENVNLFLREPFAALTLIVLLACSSCNKLYGFGNHVSAATIVYQKMDMI